MDWYSNLLPLLAQAAPAADAAQAAQAEAQATGIMRLVIAVAILVGSFVLGGMIARGLRMADYGFKIGLVVFALIAGVAIDYFGWPPKLGIDLSGGVVLVYEVDTDTASADWMSSAVARINEQLNAEGGEKLAARPIGEDQIQIDVPEGVALAEIDERLTGVRDTAGVMLNEESRRQQDGKTVLIFRANPTDQDDLDMGDLIAAVSRRINPGGVKELTIRQYGAEQIEVIIPEVEEREVEQIKKKISTSGLLIFRIVANQTDDKDIIKVALRTTGHDVYIGGRRVGRWVKAGPELLQTLQPPTATYREAPDGTMEILVRIDPFNVDGRYLDRAAQGFDERGLAVDFTFDSAGGERFRQLTRRNLPDEATGLTRNLGIILDGEMLSAPRIQSTIGSRGQITGNFTSDEVDFLVGVLNAGSLPASLRPDPISQQRISAQLGDDTIRAGANAMLISTAAILLFMLVYYRFAGLVADIAVTLNVVITVALMILIKAAFTLPGLAGLVLTVGMAVDANVLIYERIREESDRGASLRMAIRNGFARATGTIVDANITTLITALVLYTIGTDQIKGFAVTLILGLLVSMFTAIFVARVIFDIAERKRWLTQLKMMRIVGHTEFDFIRWRTPALVGSIIVIAIGLTAATMRGKGLLDIDFTGGSSVQLVFAEGKQLGIADVRRDLADLPDVAVSSVGEGGLEFKVDTSDNDIEHVQQMLKEKFGEKLKTYSMSFGELAMIEPADAAAEPSADTPQSPAAEPSAEPQSEAKPAAEPAQPAPKEPAESQAPETPAPTTTPTDDEDQPAETDSESPPSLSRSAARRSVEVASTGDAGTLLALLQEEPQPEATAAEEEAPKTEETPPAAEIPEEKPATEQPADDQAAEDASEQPAESRPAAAPSAPETPAEAAADSRGTPGSMVGGTRAELTFPEAISHEPLEELVDQQLAAMKLRDVAVQLTNPSYSPGSEARYETWTLDTTLKPDQTRDLLDNIRNQLAATPVFPSSSEIGGKVAGDTQMMAMYAMLASMVMIVLYVWIRFQNVIFGLGAVVALLHDVMITIAFLALSAFLSPYLGFLLVDPFKISLPVVAALLTIVGFSINDTIVVFDRIREVRGKSPELTPKMINVSVNQTLSRTLLTSGTVFIASLILYIVGGPGIHPFAYAMLVGVIAGTYSSVYIAAPVLLWLKKPAARATAQPTGSMRTAAASRN